MDKKFKNLQTIDPENTSPAIKVLNEESKSKSPTGIRDSRTLAYDPASIMIPDSGDIYDQMFRDNILTDHGHVRGRSVGEVNDSRSRDGPGSESN